MRFARTYIVKRQSDSVKNELGAYVDGSSTRLTIRATILPVDSTSDIDRLPEGVDPASSIVILTSQKLNQRGNENMAADTVIYNDQEYELQADADYTAFRLKYYRYYGVLK